MYAVTYPDNPEGYLCYICNETPRDRDMFQVPDLPHPYNWMCSKCLVQSLLDGTLTISNEPSEDTPTCWDCGETGVAYCESCYIGAVESAQEDHSCETSCNWCGSFEEVYCYEHAQSEWNLTDASEVACKECGASTDYSDAKVLCPDCDTQSQRVTAAAAEHIEVSWE